MEVVGREMNVENVVEEVLEDAAFYRRSGGGACISGGEPLLQKAFTLAFLKDCQDRMIDTAIETCCFGDWETVSEVAQYTDLMLIDIKHMNPAKHLEGTGVSNTRILENIAKLSALGKKIRIRIPLIPGYNDSEENLMATAAFMADNGIRHVDLLPFHLIGEYKYSKLGKGYACAATREPTTEEMVLHCALFESFGIHATVGGTDIEAF
jgi:pyruvate formate lyase activating enzyme